VLAKALELGSCGVQWQPPDGATGEHTDERLIITADDGTIWRVMTMPAGFAIGAGEETALSDDIHASAEWSGTRVIEAKLGRIGEGRCARVLRQLRNRSFVGELIVPVAKGAIDISVQSLDLEVARAALDNVAGNVDVTKLPERPKEVELPGAGVACEPPLRFLPVPTEGRGTLIRSGLDGWQRIIEIWRIGRHKLKGRDLPAELIEHANKSVAEWPSVQTQSTQIDDFGVCMQIEQAVAFVERGMQRVGMMRWWIAGDQTLWRLSSVAPVGPARDELRADLEQIQQTFRRI
jgi:hypothetical protein